MVKVLVPSVVMTMGNDATGAPFKVAVKSVPKTSSVPSVAITTGVTLTELLVSS